MVRMDGSWNLMGRLDGEGRGAFGFEFWIDWICVVVKGPVCVLLSIIRDLV